MIRILNRQRPGLIFDHLSDHSFALKRPNLIFFYDNSQTRKGKQCFPNCAAYVSRKLDFDWHSTVLNNDALRVKLKECLFKYPTAAGCFFPDRKHPRISRTKVKARENKYNNDA